jgi:hypothetical protein
LNSVNRNCNSIYFLIITELCWESLARKRQWQRRGLIIDLKNSFEAEHVFGIM